MAKLCATGNRLKIVLIVRDDKMGKHTDKLMKKSKKELIRQIFYLRGSYCRILNLLVEHEAEIRVQASQMALLRQKLNFLEGKGHLRNYSTLGAKRHRRGKCKKLE